jgi:hypothetical protein
MGPIKDKDAAMALAVRLQKKNIHPYLVRAD